MGNTGGTIPIILDSQLRQKKQSLIPNFTFMPSEAKKQLQTSNTKNTSTNNTSISINIRSNLNKEINKETIVSNAYEILSQVGYLKFNLSKTHPTLYHSVCINKLSQCALKEEKDYLSKEISLVDKYTEEMLQINRLNRKNYELTGGNIPIKKISKRNFYDFDSDINLEWKKEFGKQSILNKKYTDSQRNLFKKWPKKSSKQKMPKEKKKIQIKINMPKMLNRIGYPLNDICTNYSTNQNSKKFSISTQKEIPSESNHISSQNAKNIKDQFKKVQFAIAESLSSSHSNINHNNIPSFTNTKTELSSSSLATVEVQPKQ